MKFPRNIEIADKLKSSCIELKDTLLFILATLFFFDYACEWTFKVLNFLVFPILNPDF